MDLKKVKEKLAQLKKNGKSGDTEKVDFKKLLWKPKLGEQEIRIVPSKYSPEYPFCEISVHNYTVFRKTVFALTNFGENDPVVELVKQLRTSGDKDDAATAKSISPRNRIFAQVIVRGEEHLGVRLWEFGSLAYEALLAIINHKDYGDITDVHDGTDLTVEGYEDVIPGSNKKYIAVRITGNRRTSPLSENAKEVEKWLNEQTNPLEMYRKWSYDEIKEGLKKYLFPEEAAEEEDGSGEDNANSTTSEIVDDLPFEEVKEEVKEEVVKKQTSKSTPKTTKTETKKEKASSTGTVKGGVKSVVKDKIDALFGDD